ncbi:N-acetyl-gamma-glutamyl-phosphate reductase [Curvivirga aplysinae]|uniref:N-acetyl-gamma-glutamyl-phosphate reductase n=1 Tax=Curvivirga aplysinae TaxID=2529852 RepID=UPI0012BD067E|nr:N-acetyl-gamma-glutamyl-phosphate reductase [Curvivirga aplysinae]MTI09033.1 N-acetyl-gamma-glutamyl-phosphate reductase [Curvivirga aplysinae]
MSETSKVKIGILGASGYTGADLVRLLINHENADIRCLTANSHAGKPMEDVYPHLGGYGLPDLVTWEQADWDDLDVVFCGLPHGTTQDIIAQLPEKVKVVDLSADFRLENVDTYAQWYGHEHRAPDLQITAAYGLTELNRDKVAKSRLVACPGCYPTATLLALVPLVQSGVIQVEDMIIDAKSGVTGAGRGLKQNTLFCEIGEGLTPYGVASHRHAPEIEQEIAKAAGADPLSVQVNFTPHLIPMSRGELITAHVKLSSGKSVDDLRATLTQQYANEPFVRILGEGKMPQTQMVRGSNNAVINVFEDRIKGRAIVIAAIDNLVKGSSGQAVQNMNVMLGLDEATSLRQVAMFP